MGYSTTLYAIDLDRLKESIGCGDSSLTRAIENLNSSDPIEPTQRRLHWIAILEDGTITLDQIASSFDDVLRAYSALGKHDAVHFLGQNAETQKRLFKAFGEITTNRKGGVAKILFHPKSMDLTEFHAYEDHADEGDAHDSMMLEAVAALVNGTVSDDIPSNCYRYAFQQLCRLFGRQLDDGDAISEIAPLKLETRLAEPREILGVPSDGDFPIISFLAADEVEVEIEHIEKKGIPYPQDVDIDAGRKAFIRCLKEAAADHLAVVTFYY